LKRGEEDLSEITKDSTDSSSERRKSSPKSGEEDILTVSPERQRFWWAMSEYERELAALERHGLEDDVDSDSVAEVIAELEDLLDETGS